MGRWGFLFFGEKDNILVEEIAKLHNVSKDVVAKLYKNMLEGIKNEIEVENKD